MFVWTTVQIKKFARVHLDNCSDKKVDGIHLDNCSDKKVANVNF